MPPTALVIPLPFNPSTAPDHPALRFYAAYGPKFPKTPEQWRTQPYDEFYAKDCRMRQVDGSWVEGGEECWGKFRELYAKMGKYERELSGMIVVTREEERYEIHVEFLTKVGSEKREVPQAFVYTLGKADEGKGCMGLQFRELRCYYDWERLVGEE